MALNLMVKDCVFLGEVSELTLRKALDQTVNSDTELNLVHLIKLIIQVTHS